jgi:DNA polymerase-3 subunit delta
LATLLALPACTVRPLYAPAGSEAGPQADLPAISIAEPVSRVEQVFRNTLVFALRGGAAVEAPRYQLAFRLTIREREIAVERDSGTPNAYQLSGDAAFLLKDMATGASLFGANVTATSSYTRSSQNFANLRARRDAEERLAETLAQFAQARWRPISPPAEWSRSALAKRTGIALLRLTACGCSWSTERPRRGDERARQVERVAVLRGGGGVSRFGSDEISRDPSRVSDEVFSAQLFGGEPVIAIRVLDGRHNVIGALQPVLDNPPQSAWVVVEAGELKKDSALLRAFLTSAASVAVPTYHLEGRELVSFIQSAASEAGMRVDPDAMELLTEHLGGDRLAARAELDKLFLYVGESGPVSAESVEAIVGDTSEVRSDHIIDAALLGEAEALESGLDSLRAEGGSAVSLASTTLRHLVQLWTMRIAVDAGSPLSSALERARPPVFPRRRGAVEATLRRWPADDLAEARRDIDAAVLSTRLQPNLEMAIVSHSLHALARQAQRLVRNAP